MQNERDRRPIDPPPIVQLRIASTDTRTATNNYLQSPYIFMCVTLEPANAGIDRLSCPAGVLAGTIVSSLYRLRDVDNTEAGFFVFGDTSVRGEGSFRLKFCLFEITANSSTSCSTKFGAISYIKSVTSDVFTSFACKVFPGMQQTTFLSRTFSDQGVRLRIRKETRLQNDKHQSGQNHEQRTVVIHALEHEVGINSKDTKHRGMQTSGAILVPAKEEPGKVCAAYSLPLASFGGSLNERFYSTDFPIFSNRETEGCAVNRWLHVQGLAPLICSSDKAARHRDSRLENDLSIGRYSSYEEGHQSDVRSIEEDYVDMQHFLYNDPSDLRMQFRGYHVFAPATSAPLSSQSAILSRDYHVDEELSVLNHTFSLGDNLTLPPILSDGA